MDAKQAALLRDVVQCITTLDEDDLIGLLKVCRKARKMYAAANKMNNE
jgi:hypothetical protein